MERREFLKKSTVAATAMMLPVASAERDRADMAPYNSTMVIDALGAPAVPHLALVFR